MLNTPQEKVWIISLLNWDATEGSLSIHADLCVKSEHGLESTNSTSISIESKHANLSQVSMLMTVLSALEETTKISYTP